MSGFAPTLPAWLSSRESRLAAGHGDRCQRMRYVLDVCGEQVRRGDGGPFAAAIFDLATGALLATGVNRVEPEQCSLLHAEIVAIARAQQRLGRYNLGAGGARYELVSSAAPCAMCLGAIPWAGLSSVVVAARDEDVRAIGFDEGLKPQPWAQALTGRGITLYQDVGRPEAVNLLRAYVAAGGKIYNGAAG